MADANILCVIGAANCLECMAKGLRSDFAKYRSLMVIPILEKFKEKKVNVVEALSNCLDAMAVTVSHLCLAFSRFFFLPAIPANLVRVDHCR